LKNLVIAIDGPAASGKSTTSKLAAQRLGYIYVDTGAMYRAMTLKVLEHHIDTGDKRTIAELAEKTEISFKRRDGELRVLLDQRDVTESIRSQAVTKAVSAVSMVEEVRESMVRIQRSMAEQGGIVVEGRDIGTVVFPKADLKIFMVADVRQRATRRQKELAQQGTEVVLDELVEDIRLRDQKDSGRGISPLRKASDAIELDTSDLSIEQQVEFIVREAEKIQRQRT